MDLFNDDDDDEDNDEDDDNHDDNYYNNIGEWSNPINSTVITRYTLLTFHLQVCHLVDHEVGAS